MKSRSYSRVSIIMPSKGFFRVAIRSERCHEQMVIAIVRQGEFRTPDTHKFTQSLECDRLPTSYQNTLSPLHMVPEVLR